MKMVLADIQFFCIVIIFAHIVESKVIILRDYDEEPFFIDHQDRGSTDKHQVKHQAFSAASGYKPKRAKSKQAILHYGRHIYHLDSFDDITKLRSKLAKLYPDYFSYGYFDINDLIRSNTVRSLPPEYIQDLVILSQRPIRIQCNDKQCDEDLRKFSKISRKEDMIWKHKKMPVGHLKRFQIVDNTVRHKPQKKTRPKQIYVSSEESREKKKKIYSSESNSDESKDTKESKESKESKETKESKESKERTAEKGSESYENEKKKLYGSNSKSSEEELLEYTTRRPTKYDVQSQSHSDENWKNDFSESRSDEDFTKRKKKKYYDSSDETKRKRFEIDDVVLQGNKIYHASSALKPKKAVKNDVDRRRRLQQFLPKRYHWKASEIHDLGYYWFNGPRGRYPEPTSLLYKKK